MSNDVETMQLPDSEGDNLAIHDKGVIKSVNFQLGKINQIQ